MIKKIAKAKQFEAEETPYDGLVDLLQASRKFLQQRSIWVFSWKGPRQYRSKLPTLLPYKCSSGSITALLAQRLLVELHTE